MMKCLEAIGFIAGWCLTALTAAPPAIAATAAMPAPPEVRLAADGRALHSIVVPRDASPAVRDAAATLAMQLKRISNATFTVEPGDGSRGIVVGVAGTFDALPFPTPFTDKPADREGYVLRTMDQGLFLIGATELAVEHAVWDLLHRLGMRQWFPGEVWEHVPRIPELSVAVATVQRPDYLYRRIWYGWGNAWGTGYDDWVVRNRTSLYTSRASLVATSAHMYQGFATHLEQQGLLKEEHLALVKGRRPRNEVSQKFCFSNPEIRRLFREAAVAAVQVEPKPDSISREPSDLHNWCECEPCRALGSISDVATLVANESAIAIGDIAPNTYVTMYAYSAHSPPPNIQVHPRVMVNIATAFIRGGFTLANLIEGWGNKGATLGIREYYGVHTWHRDLPGRGRAANINSIQRSIPWFHAQGARFLSAESLNNWGPNGLSYYLASRMLWDVTEAERLDEHVEEFMTTAFGPAAEPMRRFYQLIGVVDRRRPPRMGEDLIGRMYRILAEAHGLADDHPPVQARIDHFVLYTRYLELYQAYRQSDNTPITKQVPVGVEGPRQRTTVATVPDQESLLLSEMEADLIPEKAAPATIEVKTTVRQDAFETMLRFGYRMRRTNMIDAYALYRDLNNRDSSVLIPPAAGWQIHEPRNPWKSSEPFSKAEMESMLREGIANNAVQDFEIIEYGDELASATRLKLERGSFADLFPRNAMGSASSLTSGRTWFEKPTELSVRVTVAERTGEHLPVRIELYDIEEGEEPITFVEVPADGQERVVQLSIPQAGHYRLRTVDRRIPVQVTWPAGMPLTVTAGQGNRWGLYFYVPRGTREVIGYASIPDGIMLNASGETAFDFKSMEQAGHFRVPVPAGHDGKLWKMHHIRGSRELLSVPNLYARHGDELLLPVEVIEADAKPTE